MIIEGEETVTETPTDLPAEPVSADPPAAAEPAPDPEEASRSAFREGAAAIDPNATPESPVPSPPKDAADVAAVAAAKVAPVVVDPAKPLDPAAAAKAEDDAEAADMGLRTKKANDRFREMKSEIREVAPLREVLKETGITSPEMLKETIETARRTAEWEAGIQASTATPEQFGAALNVIKMMNSNEPTTLKAVYDALGQQMEAIGAKIGISPSGDPLAKYPDLQAAVESLDITPEFAAEVAQRRAADALRDENHQRAVQTENQTLAQQNAAIEARNVAVRGIDEMSNELAAKDPDFKAKLAMITPAIQEISKKFPPHEWVQRIATLYSTTRLPPPQVQRVRPGHVPMRPSQPAAGMQAEPTPENAFRIGAATVSQ